MKNTRVKVPEVEDISKEEFAQNYVGKNAPLKIRGGVKHWDAVRLWNNEYLQQMVGFNTVEVETSRDQFEGRVFEDVEAVNMPFSQFLERLTLPEGETDYFVGSWLFPVLTKDVPDLELFETFEMFYKRRMLMARGGNSIAFHHDWYENILCQVSGYKKLTLVDIAERAYMYPIQEGKTQNYSPIDIHQLDYEKYPRFGQATLYETEIHPGDVLYIPFHWWHTVDSFERNIAISCSFYEGDRKLLFVIDKMHRHNALDLEASAAKGLQAILDSQADDRQKCKQIYKYAKERELSSILLMYVHRSNFLGMLR